MVVIVVVVVIVIIIYICKLKKIIPPQQYKTISIAVNTNVLIVIVYHSKLSTSKDVK